MSLKLEIVTPEKRVADLDVDSVTVPTASGEVGLLPHHAPLISAVKPGVLSYSTKGNTERLAVSGGFVEVNGDKVAVLVDLAETGDEIDADSARATREEAERQMAAAGAAPVEDAEAAREVLDLATARFTLASRKSA